MIRMTFEINIKNENHELQIDGDLVNYYLYQSGSANFSMPGGWVNNSPYANYQTVVSSPPAHVDKPFIWAVKFSPSNWYVPLGSHLVQSSFYKIGVLCEAGASVSVPYALWDYPKKEVVPPVEDVGIEMYSYDSSGNRITGFSSAQRYLEYVNTYTVACPIGTGGALGQSTYITVQDAVNHYFQVAPIGLVNDYWVKSGATVAEYLYATMLKVQNATTLRVSPRMYQSRNEISFDSGRKSWTTFKIMKIHEFAA